MSVFEYTDYRQALRWIVDRVKSTDPGFSHAKFAEVIRAEKTFVSKVFGEKAHFSEDHMYLVYSNIPMSDLERRYLDLAYNHTRSGLAERQNELLQEMEEVRDRWRQTGAHLSAQFTTPRPGPLENPRLVKYYLEPWAQIVHIYLTLEPYQRQPSLLIGKLGMAGEEHLQSVLRILESCDLVAKKGDCMVPVNDHIHLDSTSDFLLPHQTLVRVRSGEHILRLPISRRFIFSVTFSSDEKTQELIRQAFLGFSKEVEKMVRDTDPKDVYQMNFELFPWSVR